MDCANPPAPSFPSLAKALCGSELEPDAGRAGTAGDVKLGTDQAGAFLHPGQTETALTDVRRVESVAVIDNLEPEQAKVVGETDVDPTGVGMAFDVLKRLRALGAGHGLPELAGLGLGQRQRWDGQLGGGRPADGRR